MKPAPLPENESERLAALRNTNLLDSRPEERLDRLTRITQKAFGVPIVLISLVDEHRQWFKSRQGLAVCETHRDLAFCSYTILGNGLFEVTDASLDERFVDNPLVVGEPNIRFYAGRALSSKEGHKIGSLCLIDSKPRKLSSEEKELFSDLTATVQREILHDTTEKNLLQTETEKDYLHGLIELLPDIVIIADSENRLSLANSRLQQLTAKSIAEGQHFTEFLPPDIASLFTALSSQTRETGIAETATFNIDRQTNETDEVLHLEARFEQAFKAEVLIVVRDVSSFINQQQLLSNSERRLHSILEGTNVGTWEWNVQTGDTVYNERWANIVGYTLSELEPVSIDTWMALAHPDDVKRSAELLEKHFNGELSFYDLEARMRHKNGHWVWVHDRGRLVSRTTDGEPLLIAGTHEDITKQKETEQRVESQRLFLENIFNSDVAAFIVLNAEGQFTYANEEAVNVLGLTLNDAPEKNGATFNDPRWHITALDGSEFPQEQLPFAIVSETGQPVKDVRHAIRWPNGEWKALSVNGAVLYDEHGEPQYVFAVRDITEQIKSEQALEKSESRLRGLFELSPIGIALNDYETGAFIDLNDALLEPTGYCREEFISLSYWDVTPREYETEELQQLELLETTGRYGPFEKEYIRKDGSRYPVVLNGMMVHDDEGRRLIWSIVEDISERKRNDEIKNQFVSTVSHELRTPITAISGSLELLLGSATGELPAAAIEMIEIARKNSQRLNLLINDILDLEKLLAGKMELRMKILSANDLLAEIVNKNKPFAERFQVTLQLDSAEQSPFICVDSQRFEQVITNLISNAVKFSPPKQRVVIRVENSASHVRISVTDFGAGIPESFQPRVFEKFAQANASNTRATGGTGLGLAISKEITERLQGKIDYRTSDKGTEFFVLLPHVRNDRVSV